MTNHPCDHTGPRRYVYGGMRGDEYHCRCGKVFTAADFPKTPHTPAPEGYGRPVIDMFTGFTVWGWT